MRQILAIFLLAVLLVSCGEADISKITVDPGFSTYVNGFTSGVVSSESTVKVVLMEPHPDAKAGALIDGDLFDFEPSLKGSTCWLDEQTIEFRPTKKLPSGKTFVATFNLGGLLDVTDDYEELKFGFVVIRQSLFVTLDGMRTLDVNDFSKQELMASVKTSDVADPAAVEQCITATQDGTTLELEWTHAEDGKSHSFKVLGVERGDSESEVELEWSGEPIGADTDDDLDVRIPPLDEFSLIQVTTKREPGFHFSLQFSDPVDPRQNLAGLVHIQSGLALKFTIENNEVKAYPVDKLLDEETIIIEPTVKNIKGQLLDDRYEETVEFNMELPAIKALGDGVIMPTSGGGIKFPFAAINLKAVNLRVVRIYEENVSQFLQVNQLSGSSELTRVGRMVHDGTIDLVTGEAIDYSVWNNFAIDLGSIVKPEPGAIYRVLISFERYQSLYPCSGEDGDARPFKRRKLNFDDGDSYFYEYDMYSEPYEWRDREDPCKVGYYMQSERFISTNLLASDMGIIAKEAVGDQYDIIITDLNTTEPISGVSVEAFNYQNKKVGEGETNGDGVLRMRAEGKPYLMVAKQGNQRGYLRVDNGSALSMSLFEVGGQKIEKGVKGFLYGERGVWRPGDTIFLSFMLEDQQKSLPKAHPVVMELFDPLGKLYDRKVVTKGVEGLYSFKLQTATDAITGMWQAKATVGNSSYTKSLKIETIKPNRLKIDLDFADEVLSKASMISGNLSAKWLYGADGAGLNSVIEMEVANMKTAFKGFEGYQFDDRSKRFYSDEVITSEAKTNGEGLAKHAFLWDNPDDAPGMLKMKFRTKVFEQGGDFSQDFVSTKYSPFSSYVGLKLPGGTNWLTALNSEEDHAIALVTVDENGKPVNRTLDVELYDLQWNWWWESNGSDELTRYINRESGTLVKTSTVSTSDGKVIFDLEFPKPDWGRYMIRFIDRSSGHSTSEVFYVRYPGWYSNDEGGSDAASMLSLESSKASYDVGEDVEITLPSGGIGRVYVSIEKGDAIIDQFWVEATSGSTSFRFEATEQMAPNAYVSTTLIQPFGQDDNSLPMRMYGVLPVTVNNPETHLEPVIECPDELQPEKSFEVTVSEKDGKAMSYTLAVVDEGLLGLTRHKTPNPWNTFYSKEALGVRTWDLYKYVMSAQTGKMASMLAVGGDEGLNYKDDAEANRFKPVVKFIGPFFLDDGDENSHTLKLPNYIGAVRVMVVAGYEGAYGRAEKEVQVTQPLMVMSTLPRVLGPSERFTVPINVIAMNDNIKNVKVEVETNDMLLPLSSTSKTVTFSSTGDQIVPFEFEVARKLGVAKFKVTVTSGKEQSFEELEVLVRPPNPEISSGTAKVLEAGESWNHDYVGTGIRGTNEAVLQVSRIPELNLEAQLNYLIRYPHGCIEQTTSSAFPQLFLSSLVEVSDDMGAEIELNVSAAINKLRSFQVSSGGFAYWPGQTAYPSIWGTNYAGHFMLEAENKGYELPEGMKDQWIKYQKSLSGSWTRPHRDHVSPYAYSSADLMQAYRLFTLALAGSPELGAMNRLRSDTELSAMAAWQLAAAYVLAGNEDVARELANREIMVEPYRSMGWTYGSRLRDLSLILETLTRLEDTERGAALVRDIASEMNTGWHSTQGRAFALISIAHFVGEGDASDEFSFDAQANGNKHSLDSDLSIHRFEMTGEYKEAGNVSVTNRSEQVLFVSFVQVGMPVESPADKVRQDLKMNVSYTSVKGQPIDVSKLKQGTDFMATVTISHPGVRSDYEEIALSQIFPSGWQIVNTRVGEDAAVESSSYEYQDIRDDRVYTYFDLKRSEAVTFTVLLNATFVGRFYQPAVFCAPMYDESIKALEPGRWIEVLSNEQSQAVVN